MPLAVVWRAFSACKCNVIIIVTTALAVPQWQIGQRVQRHFQAEFPSSSFVTHPKTIWAMAVSTWVIVVAAVVIIVGFGISEVVIWKGVDFHALPENEVCPTIDVASLPGNQFVFRKDMYVPCS